MKPQIPGPVFDLPQVPGIQFPVSPTPTAFTMDRNGALRGRTRGSKTARVSSENPLSLLHEE